MILQQKKLVLLIGNYNVEVCRIGILTSSSDMLNLDWNRTKDSVECTLAKLALGGANATADGVTTAAATAVIKETDFISLV